MDFDLSEEQYLLQDSVRKFLEAEAPITRLTEIYNNDEGLDRKLWSSMSELGLSAIYIPEEYGGIGLEMLDLAVVSEVIGYCAGPGPFLGHAIAAVGIVLGGSEEQKQKWLPKIASGETVATAAFSEAGDLWQPEQWTIAAAGGKLTGSKRNVIFGAEADVFLVGLAGGGLAVVEKGAPGLKVEEVDGLDRTRRIAWVHFDNTPCDVLENGAAASGRVRDAGLILLAADAFGGASRSVEMTVEYAKTREQFGKTIGHFQGVKHQIADIATEVEPARGLYWYAAYAFDHVPDESERMAALAKSHLGDRFINASRKMLELHGGIGYTWDFYVQIWIKRAMFDRQFLGSPSVHRERAAVLAGW